MIGVTASSSAFKKARVVILEDEPTVAQRLEATLHELGNVEPAIATDMLEFKRIIEGEQFDAASIDWELHNVYKGPEAIELIGSVQPDAATVINTKHEVEDQARELKIDAFLRKQKDLALFKKTMENAIRLGLARQISKSLRPFDLLDLPDLSPGKKEMITEAAENIIHERARRKALELKISDNFDERVDTLTSLLQRRGWWERFDVLKYTKMSKRDKLNSLIKCADITPDELAQILEVDRGVVRITLDPKDEQIGLDSMTLLDREDDLLSILAFVLRLSHYDPELVPYFWRVKNLYAGSLDAPPWDELGLSEYLKTNGQSGIIESLTWIRSY